VGEESITGPGHGRLVKELSVAGLRHRFKQTLISVVPSLLCAAVLVQLALPDPASGDDGTDLWLQISSAAAGKASLVLHHPVYLQTGEVYEVWSKADVSSPGWVIETDVWAVVNQNWTPFTVPMSGRTNLFLWARDWTGVDENSNGVPDWWEFEHPGVWPPMIIAQPASQTAVPGSDATFRVGVSGNSTPPLSYQWYFNGMNPLAGATAASLTLTNVQLTNAGNYLVVVTNALGSVTSSNAALTVLEPPLITTQPANQTVFQGSNVTFTVTATGAMPLSYQWYFNEQSLLAGATNASLVLANVSSTNAGNYLVMVSNPAGSVISSNATLAIIVKPMIAMGGERIMELAANGDLTSWGGNQFGEFGDDTWLDSPNPVHVVGLTNIIKIASGLNYSLAIDSNGALWAWGDNQNNAYGGVTAQLGNSDFNKTNLPVLVPGMASQVVAVAGGPMTAVAVKADGTVWAWGTVGSGSVFSTLAPRCKWASRQTQLPWLRERNIPWRY
jgi:hypothetical protein